MFNLKNIAIVGGIVLIVVLGVVFFLAFDSEEKSTEPIGPVIAVPPMPKTLAEAVTLLDTSEILVAFLNEYFTIEERPGLIAYTPEEFYEKKKGAAHDFAVFTAHVLWKNRFEASVIRFNYRANGQEGTHTVAFFRDIDKPKYVTVTDAGVKMFPSGRSSADLIKSEEQRLGVKIHQYIYFPADFGLIDLREPVSGYDWINIE